MGNTCNGWIFLLFPQSNNKSLFTHVQLMSNDKALTKPPGLDHTHAQIFNLSMQSITVFFHLQIGKSGNWKDIG